MPLLEESVEAAADAVIVEFVGGDIAEVFEAMLRRPGSDIDEGGGMVEPSGQKDVEDGAVGELGLGIGGEAAIDDVGDVKFIEQGHQDTQGSKVDNGLFARLRAGEVRHSSSVKRGKPDKG